MAWTPSDNTVFFTRCIGFANSLQSIWEESRRLRGIWYDNAVSGDTDFVDAANRTKQDVTDIITLCDALDAFFTNGAVTAADRKSVLSRMLRGPSA